MKCKGCNKNLSNTTISNTTIYIDYLKYCLCLICEGKYSYIQIPNHIPEKQHNKYKFAKLKKVDNNWGSVK